MLQVVRQPFEYLASVADLPPFSTSTSEDEIVKTRRDKAGPRWMLVPRRGGLADLADRLMTLMYGSHAETALKQRLMHQAAIVDHGTLVVGDDDEVIALVSNMIFLP